jgi:hypothetical protein
MGGFVELETALWLSVLAMAVIAMMEIHQGLHQYHQSLLQEFSYEWQRISEQ